MGGWHTVDLPRAVLLRLRHGDWRGLYTCPNRTGNDRTTSDWRQVLQTANLLVRERGNETLGTRHLLLGLLSLDDGPALQAFRLAHVDPAKLFELIDSWTPRGETKWDPPRMLGAGEFITRPRFVGLSRRSLDVMERASKLARQRAHPDVNSAHLLASLVKDSRVAGMLRRAGVDTRALCRFALSVA